MRTEHPTCDDICRKVRERTDTVCLSFSNGKDSLAAWLILRRHFKRIVPVYRYLCPDLEFIERSLTYYEKFFGAHIHRVPSAYFWRCLNFRFCMTPAQAFALDEWDFRPFTALDACKDVLEDEGLPADTPIAYGWRYTDNMGRQRSLLKNGGINKDGQVFYPAAFLTNTGLMDLLKETGCNLPVDYQLWGRSFDCCRWWFMPALREHYPRDYARIMEWFPLVAMEERRWA